MRIYGELLDVMLDIACFVLIGDNMDGEQLELYSKWFDDIQGAFFSPPCSWFPPFRRAMTNLVNALKGPDRREEAPPTGQGYAESAHQLQGR